MSKLVFPQKGKNKSVNVRNEWWTASLRREKRRLQKRTGGTDKETVTVMKRRKTKRLFKAKHLQGKKLIYVIKILLLLHLKSWSSHQENRPAGKSLTVPDVRALNFILKMLPYVFLLWSQRISNFRRIRKHILKILLLFWKFCAVCGFWI